MKKTVSIIAGVVVLLAIVIGVYSKLPSAGVSLGALSGPDISSPYLGVNGLNTWYAHPNLTGGTTTPCIIQSPNATTTFDTLSLQITVASSTQTVWRLATSTNPNATTSTIATFTLPSGSQGSFVVFGSSTSSIIPPNTYIAWGMEGAAPNDSTKLLGTCGSQLIQQ